MAETMVRFAGIYHGNRIRNSWVSWAVRNIHSIRSLLRGSLVENLRKPKEHGWLKGTMLEQNGDNP